jgi:streptomycin 6-kinase
MNAGTREFHARIEERLVAWGISVDDLVHSANAVLVFGHRDRTPVVVKVVNRRCDEWRAGAVLDAFAGRGVVHALDHVDGSVLLPRVLPGKSLAGEELDDAQATAILADVIASMAPAPPPSGVPTVESWGEGFERYLIGGATVIPVSLVEHAQRTWAMLCASQTDSRLLHGDLHHHNVILDSRRGWLAIDPKGAVGELACEVGAALRNPYDQPDLFAAAAVIHRRVDLFARQLGLDPARVLGWAFAEAVLAAIWELEDEGVLQAGRGWIAFARAVRPMLDG